jgi:hypothetical protein
LLDKPSIFLINAFFVMIIQEAMVAGGVLKGVYEQFDRRKNELHTLYYERQNLKLGDV